MLSAPQKQLNNHNYAFVAQLDETLSLGDQTYSLANHEYKDCFEPKGNQYLKSFSIQKSPEWVFQIGRIQLKKSVLVVGNKSQVLVKYELVKSPEALELCVNPLYNFRQMHKLTHANDQAKVEAELQEQGVKVQLYEALDPIFIQFSKKAEIQGDAYWHNGVKYRKEEERGYPCYEDLLSINKLRFSLKEGESIVVSLGLEKSAPSKLSKLWEESFEAMPKLKSPKDHLLKAAKQFVINDGTSASIIAGYPWFGRWGRDTFIALPGLMKVIKDKAFFELVFTSMFKDFKDGLLTNVGVGDAAKYNSADASLWLFWALQHYAEIRSSKKIWKEHGDFLKSVLNSYKNGTHYNIGVQENGLLHAGDDGVALTWMDAVYNGIPATQRKGCPVELQALWYNALCFCLEMAEDCGDEDFISEWKRVPEKVKYTFQELFWDADKRYLADVVISETEKDWSLRPNQLFALSLPYPLLIDERAKSVLEMVKRHLYTPKGMRTLSPEDTRYVAIYEGDQEKRDASYHQGIVWPWLFGAYVDATIKLDQSHSAMVVEEIWNNLAAEMNRYGLGSISELFDADSIQNPKGATSQAWSVTELLRINKLLKTLKKKS
jgi:predicted glycogen debranching enzyme